MMEDKEIHQLKEMTYLFTHGGGSNPTVVLDSKY